MAGGGGAVMGYISAFLGELSTRTSVREQVRGMLQQATEAKIQAGIEELNAKTAENDIRDSLLRTLASNQAAAGASGITGGSVEAAAFDDIDQAMRAARGVNLEGMLRAGALRRQARLLRKQAKGFAVAGNLGASASALGSISGGMGGFGGGPTSTSTSNSGGNAGAGFQFPAGYSLGGA